MSSEKEKNKALFLKVLASSGETKEIAVATGRHIIGCAKECAICIDDTSVASQHAMIVIDDGLLRLYPIQRKVFVKRKTEANNTRANKEIVDAAGTAIEIGDVFSVGDVRLVLSRTNELESKTFLSVSMSLRPPPTRTEAIQSAKRQRDDEIFAQTNAEFATTILGQMPLVQRRQSQNSFAKPTTSASIRKPTVRDGANAANTNATLNINDEVNDVANVDATDKTISDSHQQSMESTPVDAPQITPEGKAVKKSPGPLFPKQSAVARPHSGGNTRKPATRRYGAPGQALVPVAKRNNPTPKEFFALTKTGALDVVDNIKAGAGSLFSDGPLFSRKILVLALSASTVGLILLADNQTQAINDPTLSPVHSLRAKVSTLGLEEVEVSESADRGLSIAGFVPDENAQAALSQLTEPYVEDLAVQMNVAVVSRVMESMGEVLRQYGMNQLTRTYTRGGEFVIEGYVGPNKDWSAVRAMLERDFPRITRIDDSNVETLSDRLKDLRQMLQDVQLEKRLRAVANSANVEVKGSLGVHEIDRWIAVRDRFHTRYEATPTLIDKVDEIVPGKLPAVPVEATFGIGDKKYVITNQGRFGEGEAMPDGTKVVTIEKWRIIFDKNGYHYAQPYKSEAL